MMVAAGTQSRGVIVFLRAAAAARRRCDRAAWPAFETARDLPHRRRPDPADLAEILDDAAHAGGTDLCRPSRGASSGLAAGAAAAGGLRAATLSGSQISRSAGVHSSTAQITSRSSSRIDDRGGGPQRRHLPGADLQPGVGQAAAHLGRLPDAALGGGHPQVPAHQLTPFPYRAGRRSGHWRSPTPARCGRRGRGYSGSWWTATSGRAIPGSPSGPCRGHTATTRRNAAAHAASAYPTRPAATGRPRGPARRAAPGPATRQHHPVAGSRRSEGSSGASGWA